MHILITTIVDPLHSAPSRLHQFITHLSEKHDVDVLSVRDSWKIQENVSGVFEEQFSRMFVDANLIYLSKKDESIYSQEMFCGPRIRRLFGRGNPKYDLVLDYNTITIGARASEILGAPRIYDLADDIADMIRNSPQMHFPLSLVASLISRRLIRWSLNLSDAVTGTSYVLLKEYNVPDEKSFVIPNGVPSDFATGLDRTQVLSNRPFQDEFTVGYVGVLREWIDFVPVFEAMKLMKGTRPVRLMIIGEEGKKMSVSDQAEKFGVSDMVNFVGTVPHGRVAGYLMGCDCGIIPFARNPTSHMALPLKLFEYFSTGLPVVSTEIMTIRDSSLREEVMFYRDGPGLAAIFESIIDNPSGAKELAARGREKVLKEYTWENIMRHFDRVVQGVV